MSNEEQLNWLINIENAAAEVAKKYDSNTVLFVFKKYGTQQPDDLSPSDYSTVFSELYQMVVD